MEALLAVHLLFGHLLFVLFLVVFILLFIVVVVVFFFVFHHLLLLFFLLLLLLGLGRGLLLALLLLLLRQKSLLLLAVAALSRGGPLGSLPEPDVKLVERLALQVAGALVRADVDERPGHPLHRRRVQSNVHGIRGILHRLGIGKRGTPVGTLQHSLENLLQHALVQSLVRLQLQQLRPRFEQGVGGVRGHGARHGHPRAFPLLTLLSPENRARGSAVGLVLLIRVAADVHLVLTGGDVTQLRDEHLREMQTQAHVDDALVASARRDER